MSDPRIPVCNIVILEEKLSDITFGFKLTHFHHRNNHFIEALTFRTKAYA